MPASDTDLHYLRPDPENPDWNIWESRDITRFGALLGPLGVRRDGDNAIVRLQPHRGLSNPTDRVHGGALMTFIDMAMFAAPYVFELETNGGLTVDLSVQFVGAADCDRPVDAIVQLTRETNRLLFLRGTVQQADEMVASFIGILRKSNR